MSRAPSSKITISFLKRPRYFHLLKLTVQADYENSTVKVHLIQISSLGIVAILPNSQCFPVHPSAQLHLYPPSLLTHVPPFKQGTFPHSSISEYRQRKGQA